MMLKNRNWLRLLVAIRTSRLGGAIYDLFIPQKIKDVINRNWVSGADLKNKKSSQTMSTSVKEWVEPECPDFVGLIRNSSFFDETYYLDKNKDVADSGIDPADHYFRFGAAELRNPSLRFATGYYLKTNQDVACCGMNPLIHYILFGLNEGRKPTQEAPNSMLNQKEVWEKRKKYLSARFLNEKRNQLMLLNEDVIFKKIDGSDVVSFDVFDTLVERIVSDPHDVFRIAERVLRDEGVYCGEFAMQRVTAEKKAREQCQYEEITLDEIYEVLFDGLNVDVKAIKEVELRVEETCIRTRPLGKKIFDYARSQNKKIIIVSDFYHGKKWIEKILAQCCYSGIEKVYVSSEYRATKHSGKLFTTVRDDYSASLGSILHVGDNLHSDILQAMNSQLEVAYFKKYIEQSSDDKLFNRLTAIYSETRSLDSIATRDCLSRIFAEKMMPAENPFMLGALTLGPLLFNFAKFLKKQINAKGYKEIYFVARDGFYPKVVFDLLTSGESDISSHYLIASRKIIHSCTLTCRNEIKKVADIPYFPSTLSDLLRNRFLLSDSELDKIAKKDLIACGFDSLEDVIDQSVNHNLFLKLLFKYSDMILECSSEKRSAYCKYLRQMNLSSETSCLVDIGYSGSTQIGLSQLLKESIGGLYFITSEGIEAVDSLGLEQSAFWDDYITSDHVFYQFIQIMELVFSATHGSAAAITPSSDFIFSSNNLPDEVIHFLNEFRDGAIYFSTKYLAEYQDLISGGNLPSDLAVMPMLNLLESPPLSMAKVFSDVAFEDAFGGEQRFFALSKESNDAFMNSCWKNATQILLEQAS